MATSAGYRTLRFTDRQLTNQPHQVAQAIAAVLANRYAARELDAPAASG